MPRAVAAPVLGRRPSGDCPMVESPSWPLIAAPAHPGHGALWWGRQHPPISATEQPLQSLVASIRIASPHAAYRAAALARYPAKLPPLHVVAALTTVGQPRLVPASNDSRAHKTSPLAQRCPARERRPDLRNVAMLKPRLRSCLHGPSPHPRPHPGAPRSTTPSS